MDRKAAEREIRRLLEQAERDHKIKGCDETFEILKRRLPIKTLEDLIQDYPTFEKWVHTGRLFLLLNKLGVIGDDY